MVWLCLVAFVVFAVCFFVLIDAKPAWPSTVSGVLAFVSLVATLLFAFNSNDSGTCVEQHREPVLVGKVVVEEWVCTAWER
jgi:membrane protein implicated in regulation of membrane protease activity